MNFCSTFYHRRVYLVHGIDFVNSCGLLCVFSWTPINWKALLRWIALKPYRLGWYVRNMCIHVILCMESVCGKSRFWVQRNSYSLLSNTIWSIANSVYSQCCRRLMYLSATTLLSILRYINFGSMVIRVSFVKKLKLSRSLLQFEHTWTIDGTPIYFDRS